MEGKKNGRKLIKLKDREEKKQTINYYVFLVNIKVKVKVASIIS